jgi:hypothetical protein
VEILADSPEEAERQAMKLCEEWFSHDWVTALHGDHPREGGIEPDPS